LIIPAVLGFFTDNLFTTPKAEEAKTKKVEKSDKSSTVENKSVNEQSSNKSLDGVAPASTNILPPKESSSSVDKEESSSSSLIENNTKSKNHEKETSSSE